MGDVFQRSMASAAGRVAKTRGGRVWHFPNLSASAYHGRDEERQRGGSSAGMKSQLTSARSRIAGVQTGEPAAVAQFLKDISATVWTACRLLAPDEAEAREAFVEAMAKLRADRFARLSGYSGHGSLETFVALTVRDLLAERMLKLLQSDTEKFWRGFVRFFEGDILKLIQRHFPGAANEDIRRDAYQELCVSLLDAEYRRLKAYDGSGSFAGFVLRTVDRLLIDFMRGLIGRRRVPAAVAGGSPLDREIYELVFWQKLPKQPESLAAALQTRLHRLPAIAEIADALERVMAHAPATPETAQSIPIDSVEDNLAADADASPENRMLQAQEAEQLAAALDVLTRAVEGLPAPERLYLTIVLSGNEALPSREIARLMQRPVEDIYKLKQRVMTRLREVLAAQPAVKIWRASV